MLGLRVVARFNEVISFVSSWFRLSPLLTAWPSPSLCMSPPHKKRRVHDQFPFFRARPALQKPGRSNVMDEIMLHARVAHDSYRSTEEYDPNSPNTAPMDASGSEREGSNIFQK